MAAAEAAVRNWEAMAADPLESRLGVMLLLAADLIPPAGLVASKADESVELPVSRLSMMLENCDSKFGNVCVSWTRSGPSRFGSSLKQVVEEERRRGYAIESLAIMFRSLSHLSKYAD